jgi:zinc-ribbon domain
MTCEHCGADALDPNGVCRECGWHAQDDGGSPSLAETRAADVPAVARTPLIARRSNPDPVFQSDDRTMAAPPAGPMGRPGTRASGGTGTGRYCGTCGARIEPGEQFCGQCGTPLFSGSGVDLGTAYRPTQFAPASYGAASAPDWTPADHDAPTVEYPEMLGGMGSGYPGRMGSSYAPASPDRGGNRELRIVLGILCILGGLVSGAGAIFLAIAPH